MNNTEDDNNLNSPANQTPRDDDAMRDARRIELLGNAQTSVEKERVRAIVMALQETGVNLSIEDLREIVIDAIYASSAASLESVLSRPLLEAPLPRSVDVLPATPEEKYLAAMNTIKNEIISTTIKEIANLKEANSQLNSSIQKLQGDIRRLREVLSPRSYLQETIDIEEEISHLHSLRKEYLKRLRSLEIEGARKGINTPPEVENEITDMRFRIDETEARIKILTYDLDRQRASRTTDE